MFVLCWECGEHNSEEDQSYPEDLRASEALLVADIATEHHDDRPERAQERDGPGRPLLERCGEDEEGDGVADANDPCEEKPAPVRA
jgi:hypothetical protein